jgi:phosphatidylethanolamine/phosphatidyl-N-methylethanolamine N-methyltransferase
MSVQHAERIYSSYSRVYDIFFDAILEPGRRRAIQALEIRPGDTILEIGVGTGLSLPHYPSRCRIVGIDISTRMLHQARRRAAALGRRDVTLERMSAEALSYPDASFDRVLLSHVISCVEHPRRVIEEVHRVCRPRARAVFLNHFQSRKRLIAEGERRLTPLTRRLGFVLDIPQGLITDSGLFEVERIERVNIFGVSSVVSCLRAA